MLHRPLPREGAELLVLRLQTPPFSCKALRKLPPEPKKALDPRFKTLRLLGIFRQNLEEGATGTGRLSRIFTVECSASILSGTSGTLTPHRLPVRSSGLGFGFGCPKFGLHGAVGKT